MTDSFDLNEDPLLGLHAHVRGAREAAERLLEQTQRTPPSGWEPGYGEQARRATTEAHSLLELMRRLREAIPSELKDQLLDLIRQLLAVVRALVEILIERLQQDRPPAEPKVQDIPVL
jgi:hypothetical protein